MKKQIVLDNIARLFIVLSLLFVLFPIAVCFVVSVHGQSDLTGSYLHILSRDFHFENYTDILTDAALVKALLTSLAISVTSTAVSLIISIPAAYVFAHVNLPLRRPLYKHISLSIFLPVMLLAIPYKQMFTGTFLEDTWGAVTVPLSAQVFIFMMMVRYYASFPSEIEDAAIVMGLSPVRIFTKIYLPASSQMIRYSIFIQFMTSWNCCFLPQFMFAGSGTRTFQQVIAEFCSDPQMLNLGMAAVIIASLPCWILNILQFIRTRSERAYNIIDLSV